MEVRGMGLNRDEVIILSNIIDIIESRGHLTIENLYLYINNSEYFNNCVISEINGIVYLQRVKS